MRHQDCSLRTTLAFFLLAMCVLGPVPSAGQEPLLGDTAGVSGKPTLITPEEIELLMTKRHDESVLPDIPKDIKNRAISMVSTMINIRNTNIKAGRLSNEGCYAAIGFYHKPLFILGENEEKISFSELAKRAGVVVTAEVVSVQTGLVDGQAGTLVHVRSVLDAHQNSAQGAREFFYVSREYSFEVGGELLCYKRDGFYREQAGDFILLVARPSRHFDFVLPYAVFKIDDGMILPQPYEFLLPMVPVSLSDLAEISN